MLRFLIHLKLNFVQEDKCEHICFLHAAIQLDQHHLLKMLSFLHCVFFNTVSKIRYLLVNRLVSQASFLFYWPLYLFLCQKHTAVIVIVLQNSMKFLILIVPEVLIGQVFIPILRVCVFVCSI